MCWWSVSQSGHAPSSSSSQLASLSSSLSRPAEHALHLGSMPLCIDSNQHAKTFCIDSLKAHSLTWLCLNHNPNNTGQHTMQPRQMEWCWLDGRPLHACVCMGPAKFSATDLSPHQSPHHPHQIPSPFQPPAEPAVARDCLQRSE